MRQTVRLYTVAGEYSTWHKQHYFDVQFPDDLCKCCLRHCALYTRQCVSVFTVGWVMIHLSLNLERSLAARVAFGKFVRSPCQVFVPACYVWPKGSPWPLTIPHTAASQETTMISREGWSGWGVKIPFRFSAWEARIHSVCSWKSSSMRTSGRSAGSLCMAPVSGLSLRNLEPNVQNIREVIFGKVSSNR